LVCALLAAQSQEPLKFGITTRLVEVNVIVHDKNGPVDGLTKDDFTLFDRKKEQRIATFSVTSMGKSKAPRPIEKPLAPGTYSNRIETREESPTTATIILFDALNTQIQDQLYAKKQFLQFLKNLRPQDRVAVYLLGLRLRILNDFTSDVSRLVAAAERYSGEIVHVTALSQPDPNYTPGAGLSQPDDARSVDKVLNEFDSVMAERAIIDRVETTARALEAIANHLARVPGRKNLIWITGSFPFSVGQYGNTESQTNTNDMIRGPVMTKSGAKGRAAAGDGSGDAGGSGGGGDAYGIYGKNTAYSNPARDGFRGFGAEVKRATDAINNANIAVYPVDARGLITVPKILTAQSSGIVRPGTNSGPPLTVEMRPIGIDAMKTVAEATGGRPFFNTNDLASAVRTALDDAEVSYTLGFYADSKTLDSKFHELKVLVKRPGMEVRFRKGYLAVPDPGPTDDQRSIDIEDAIWSPLEATGVGFAGRIDAQGGSRRITLMLNRDQLSFVENNGKRTGLIDIVFVQQTADGGELERIEQKLPLSLSPAQYEALSQGFELDRSITPLPKAVQIRVVVFDRNSGRIGSLTVPIN
jgi:VWFA-related protein